MIQDVKNLKQRLITSLLIIPLFVVPLIIGGYIYQFFLIFLSTLIFYELSLITQYNNKRNSTILYVLFLLISLILLKYFSYQICLYLCFLFSIINFLINKLKSNNDWLSFNLITSYLPFLILLAIRDESNFSNGLILTFLIIIIAVISDVSGYFGGQFFGKKKIFPYISPNKTLEGTFFALFMPSVIILPIMILANLKLQIHLAFLIIILMSVGAIFGDLGASFIKRNFGVKNSSNILPGHGGVIDRLDSIIGSSVVLMVMIFIFHISGLDGIQLIEFEK